MPNLLDLSLEEMEDLLEETSGSKGDRWRAKEIFRSLYIKGATDFSHLAGLSKPLRASLSHRSRLHFYGVLDAAEQGHVAMSSDGTIKWVLALGDQEEQARGGKRGKGGHAETVFIPEMTRGTACLSSQVGCSLSCRFCHTGTMPKAILRNLSSGEILAQLLAIKHHLHDFPTSSVFPSPSSSPPSSPPSSPSPSPSSSPPSSPSSPLSPSPSPSSPFPSPRSLSTPAPMRRLTNVVMMGMGEPLYNYRNVKKAIEVMVSDHGLGLSRRRVTLSTSGVVPLIERLATDLGISLAISLHATRDDLRDELVPINKSYPLSSLLPAVARYALLTRHRKLTFEYVMLKGVNDSLADARELTRLLAHLPCVVNLIPFNPWPGSGFECSTDEVINEFARTVSQKLMVTVRRPRGREVMAACGQLQSLLSKLKLQQASA